MGFLVVLVATAASSVFGTQAHQYSSPAALAVLAAAGAFAGTLIAVGLPDGRPDGLAGWLVPLLAGAGGYALAPWLVMANRYTDAPPGSEVLFFSVVSWGALLALVLALVSPHRMSRAGGVVLALAGAAALLANWERPSSFSPLVRYAREELVMLGAGVLWVLLVLVLLRAASRGSFGTAALAAGLGGLAGAGALAALGLSAGTLVASDLSGGGAIGYGIAIAFSVAGMVVLVRARYAEVVASAYLMVPAAVSLLLALEWALGPLGPQPMLLGPVAAAAVIGAAGVTIAFGPRRRAGSAVRAPVTRRRLAAVAAITVATIAVLAGLAALAQPAMTAAVNGLRTDGSVFRASFDLYGYEVAAPWLALGAAIVALGCAHERVPLRLSWPRGVALVAAAAAWWVAGPTPLRTLTSFIPSDVQVDYGSEFARIDFAGAPTTLALAALGGALLAVTLTWVARYGTPEADDTEGPGTVAGYSEDGSRGDRS